MKYIIEAIISLIIIYIAFVFITFEANPLAWSQTIRLMFAIVNIFALFINLTRPRWEQ